MKKMLSFSCVAVFVLCAAISASAVEFAADVLMTSAGHSSSSKIFAKDKKFRTEMQGQGMYTLIREDKNVVWMVMPEQKTYMEMKIDPSQKPKVEEKVRGEVSRKLIGSEKVGKYSCQKYEVTYKEGQKTEKMYQWIAKDIKFPVKSAAIDGSWAMEYRNIRMDKQADSLFEIPAGYSKMAMPGMGGAQGMPKLPAMPKMPK